MGSRGCSEDLEGESAVFGVVLVHAYKDGVTDAIEEFMGPEMTSWRFVLDFKFDIRKVVLCLQEGWGLLLQ